MKTILILIIIICLFRLYLGRYATNSNTRKKLERRFCVLAYFALVFLAAFRGESVGADTGGYMRDYMQINSMTLSDALDKYSEYKFFYLLMWLFSSWKAPVWLFFGIIEGVYIIAIARFINKCSSDKLYSIVFFIILLFNFSLAGMKQVLAMGLILYAFLDFTEKKWVRAVIFVLLAYFTHPVVMAFLLAFVLYYLKDKRSFYIAVGIAFALIVFSGMTVMSSFVSISGNEHFETYLTSDNSYSSVMLLFYLLLFVAVVPFLKFYSKKTQSAGNVKFETACLLLACAFQYMASLSPNLFRLAYLYTPFYMVVLPNAFNCGSNSGGNSMKILVLLLAISYYAYTARNFIYSFSW